MLAFVSAGADSIYRNKIEALNEEAFPEAERTPYEGMLAAGKADCGELFAILDERKFIGFAYLLWQDEILYIYYLAVLPELRGKGYGSRILDTLKGSFPDMILVLSAETPEDRDDASDQKVRRIEFYKKNGFEIEGKPQSWHGIYFDTLCYGGHPTEERMKRFFEETEKARKSVTGVSASNVSS